MKWYEIHNYSDGDEYVTESSNISNIEDIWTTKIPWNFKKAEDYEPTNPYRFNKKTDAIRIKDALKSARIEEWNRNKHIYIRYGDKKPNWKIYSFESSEDG